MGFKNKKILITAGPTWVAIDSVRVISNTASGETGQLLADRLAKEGAKVTLVLGPVPNRLKNKKIKVIPFKFFNELKEIVSRELKTGKYRVVIHSAAVSDYAPVKSLPGKIKSGSKKLRLVLKATPKIIDTIKKIDPGIFLVGFKFEPQAARPKLIKSARLLMARSGLDLAIANSVSSGKYRAYILSAEETGTALTSKGKLVSGLASKIRGSLWTV
jgi:phosphopantothenoylcysteine decarboxylase / phosphopantothenate---cysteine ligase